MNKYFMTILSILFFVTACARKQNDDQSVAHTATETKPSTIQISPSPITPTSTLDITRAAQDEEILYQEDFEDGSAEGLFEIGKITWSVVPEDSNNNIYCNDYPGIDPGFIFGAYEWGDYATEMRVKGLELNGEPFFNLYSRFERYKWLMYYGNLNLKTGSAWLLFNDPYVDLGGNDVPVPTDGWYTLRLETYGHQIKFYVNELLVASGLDDHRSEGKAGFLANPNLKVCVDDIKVWALDENGRAANLPAKNNTVILNVTDRLANHRFPKLFYQNQFNDPSAEHLLSANYYDILTLGPEVAKSNWIYLGPTGIIRTKNPNAVILAIFSVQEYFQKDNSWTGGDFVSKLKPDWTMRDIYGEPFPSFNYDGEWSTMMNLGTDVSKFIPDYLNSTSMKSGLFDGIFYDGTNETWYNRSGRSIDIDMDGKRDSDSKVDLIMNEGLKKLLAETRAVFPEGYLITGNSVWRGMVNKTEEKKDTILADLLNGRMIEGFLNWENDGYDWQISMRTYYLMQEVSVEPKTPFIMAYCTATDYDHLRYTLASSLMFDGYFTCTNHQDGAGAAPYSATWWYDEYSVDLESGKAIQSLEAKGYLGMPVTDAYNANKKEMLLSSLLFDNDQRVKWITWRRDFQNGIVLVNPSEGPMTVDLGDTYRKILGTHDPLFNDGSLVTEITLKPKSGIILLKLP